MAEKRPVTLITGASAGIGVALARVFARNGHELVLVARREQRLLSLADELGRPGLPRPLVLPVDLMARDAVQQIENGMAAHGVEPDIVVNNAGFGLVGETASLDRAEQLQMIDLNVRALTDLSLAWVGSLRRHRGGLLNVASVAGFLPGPGSSVYYASKAYVISFSEALHTELAADGVRVTVLCPGPVPSEFQARAGVMRESYPPLITVSAEVVAEQGYRGLKQNRRVVVPGAANKAIVFLQRFVPRGYAAELVGRRSRRRYPKP